MQPPRRPFERLSVGLDGVAILLTLAAAAATIVTTSGPVPGFGELGSLELLWPVAAIVWAAALLAGTVDRNVRRFAWLVIGLTLASILTLGYPVFFLLFFTGPLGIAAVALAGLAVFGLVFRNARPRRVSWLVSPLVVVASIGLVVSGIPRSIRFSLVEPELSAYASQLLNGEATFVPRDDGNAVSIGSVPIYEVRSDSGELIFITGFVGIFEDDGAGLAYVPDGAPTGSGIHQHLTGHWYLWTPY